MQGKEMQIIQVDGKILSPGKIRQGDRVYKGMRVWLPERSKVAALLSLGSNPPIIGSKVLYLGAAAGTTVSFISDYAEVVYAVEFSPRPMQQLVRLSLERTNIIPIFADARDPHRYMPLVERVDLLIQDIAQRDQPDIAAMNIPFIRKGGELILFLKMLSIDVAGDQDRICQMAVSRVKEAGISDIRTISMDQYYTGHVAILGTRL